MPQQTTDDRISEIRQLHTELEKFLRTSLAHAIRIGELLTKQKKELGHGEFGKWIEATLPFTWQTANNYMRVYEGRKQLKLKSVCNLADAYALMNRPKSDRKKDARKPPEDAADPEDQDVVEVHLPIKKKDEDEFHDLINMLKSELRTTGIADTIMAALWYIAKDKELVNEPNPYDSGNNSHVGQLALATAQ